MAIDPDDIKAIVTARLNLGDSLDALIDSYIPEFEQRILNYCNIQEVPDGLKYVWASMVIDILKANHSTLPEIVAVLGVSAETQVGDTTTKISTNKAAIDSFVIGYSADLNRYRKLRW